MVSAFLILVPLIPLAAFQMTEPGSPPAVEASGQEPSPPPLPTRSHTGALASPDRGGPLSPFSERAVREASRGWEWKNLESPGWKILMADHFVLRGDVPVGDLRSAGAYLEEFHRMLRSALAGDTEDLKFSVRIFSDAAEFRKYAALRGAWNAESFYDPRGSEIVICPALGAGGEWLGKTLAHEFTHAYMDRVWKRTGPLWFAEGMAEYFAGFGLREGRAHPGELDRRAVLLLKLQDPMPLGDFLKLDRSEMYGPGFHALYAQAWSFVHYLFSRGDGTVDLLLRGEPLGNVEELEKGWKEHLDRQWSSLTGRCPAYR